MDAEIKTEGSQSGQEKLVKRSPLKIKQVVPLEELQQRIDNGQCKIKNHTTDVRELSSEDLQDLQLEHDGEDFYVFCSCEECLKYREVILLIMNDHFSMRSMWNALRRIIIKFYRSIIESTAVNTLDVYDSLTEDNFSWLVNGVQDANRMQHLEFMSDLSLTKNVMLVLLSAMFVAEDPHQLLELMSFQAECFVRAYSLGISDKIVTIGTGQSTTEVMMNYVLTGYEHVCKVSDEMSRFLFAFENNHMKQFGMDWVLLNKRMYQRYVYASIGPTAECILRLKAEVSPERYSELVKVYIKFDEEMNNVNNSWREVWANLHAFHMSQEDQNRRKRLKAVETIFEVIRKDVTLPYEQFIDIPNWETHEDKKLVWQNIVAYIKKRWPASDQVRLSAVVSIESCKLCNNPQEFHRDACTCVTCLIAGRPTISKLTKECKKEGICLKCSFTERVGKDGVKYVAKIFQKCVASKHGDIEGDGDNKNFTALVNGSKPAESSAEPLDTYHLSWVVFKHLKDRKPYPYKTIEEQFFCTNCKRTSCALAKKFINREISFCLAHQLMKNYQPYSITLDKLVETVPGVAMYKALSIFHDPESDDLILKTLWTFNTSLIASYFADADDDPSKPDIDQLKIVNNDIELPMEEHLEGKAKSKKFLDFFGKTLGLQSEEPNLSSVISPATLKQILLKQINRNFKVDSNNKKVETKPREISEEPPVTLEPELIKPREVVDNPKKKPPCCAEQHCKESHVNKKCSHDKDSSSRVNETRDRLRKKLNQMTNAKKNIKTISKNGTKSPLDLIKVLNKSPPSLCSLSKEMAKAQNKANVSKEINKNVAKANQEKEDKSKLDVKQPERIHTNTKNELDTSENLDEWVKNKLSFIEGSGESKKPKPASNNKKAAKKAKQKLKREEQKRVEELTDLRSQFHDLYFKEFKCKNELKEQKISKKKDKKRIGELETNIKKLSKAKSKIETNILELIATVKSANSEFKFSYLPTKEQRQEVLKKNAPVQPPAAPSKQSNKTKSTNTKSTSNPSTVYYPTEPQFVPPSEFRVPAVHNVQVAYSNSSVADPLDPSKRIVTIRRVNLPNVPETQVTVTAKGPSPDKDKLLYTFINGQIVPATSLDIQKLSVLQPTVFPTQLKPVSLPKGQHLKSQSNVQKNSALTEIPVAKTKTQLKKERKRAVKLALEMQKEEELKQYSNQKSAYTSNTNSRKQNTAHVEKNANIRNTNSRKQNNTPVEKNAITNNKKKNIESVEVLPEKLNNKNKTKKNSNIEQNKISQSKCSSSDSGINSRENSASNGKQKEGKTLKQSQVKKQVDNPVQVILIDDKQREKKADQKQKKFVDKGQFDNNQFKMLHMDEFSSESEESVIVAVVKPKLKKTQCKSANNNIQVQKSKPTKAEIKEKPTKAESKEKPTKAESKEKSTKTESKVKPTKAERKEKPTKAESKEKSTKADSKEKSTKAESKEKPTKAESKEKSTKAESKEKSTKVETKEKPTKGAGKLKKPICVRNVPAQNCTEPSAVWAAQTEETKRQKKKASKKQNRFINEANSKHHSSIVDKTATHADHIAKSLGRSMQKLNLNADTTMEFAKNTCDNPNTICNLNISIMEQLNRGVQVEDLTLPPGITLTKVDPSRAEALRAKTESIGKLSQPMQPQQQHKSMGTPIIPPSLLPHLGRFSADQSGVIMVDAMGSRSATSEMLSQTDNKKPKKNKRRSKKKKGDNPNDGMLAQQKNNESKMITLRNPMFHGPSMHNHVLSMPNRVPIAPLPMDQPAAIIKNENGMFTIRNPALHQAFSSGVQNNYRSFNPSFYSAPETCRNFSYFSDNISNNGQYSNGQAGPKCLSAIGSEVKTAQQQKKTGNQWQTNPGSLQNKNAYIGDHNLPSPLQQKYQQSNYYNNFEVFSPSSGLFDRNSHDSGHNCDESPPPSVSGFNHYLDDIPNQGRQNAKYDDMSFFRNLIPGQRLNSEVTIHNINESKFSADSPTHHVEITPISRPTSRSNDFGPEQENLQNKIFGGALGEYGDNLFAPNQMLNLNELESEDREVESFKRFSYGFEPPKEKPKANINVNDLLANSKNKPTNSSTSPYLDESLDSFVRNMNSLKLNTEEAINGTQETNRRSNWW